MAVGFRKYRDACWQAYTAVLQEVKKRLEDVTKSEAKAIAESLLVGAYSRLTTGSMGLRFSYEPQSLRTEEGTRWFLQLGNWGVGSVEDPESLKPMAVVHKKLVAALPLRAELKALREVDLTARRAMEGFRLALSPDARLRKLVLGGSCDLCPYTR